MTGAVYALIANAGIAVLFAAKFFALSRIDISFRRVGWFALAYSVGALTPASELMVRLTPYTGFFSATSSLSFCLAFLITAWGLARYYSQPISLRFLACVFVLSVAVRASIWGGQRDTMPYELLYQLPFAVAVLIGALIVTQIPNKRRADWLLVAMLWVTSAHFLVKPFASLALGSGATARDYAASSYALFSQAVSGILLTGTALVIMLVIVRDMLAHVQKDALSGLLTRRSFDARCKFLLERSAPTGVLNAVLLFDLDGFKRFNDTFGHGIGDEVIKTFTDVLVQNAPSNAILGRMGGDEFAAFLPGKDSEAAVTMGEKVRVAMKARTIAGIAPAERITTSGGAADVRVPKEFSPAMRRADRALYTAKQGGRDRVVAAGETERPVLVPIPVAADQRPGARDSRNTLSETVKLRQRG